MHFFDGSTRIHQESDRLVIWYRWSVFRGIGIGVMITFVPAILMNMDVGWVTGDLTISASIGLIVGLSLVLFQKTRIELNRKYLCVRLWPIPIPGVTLPVDDLARIAWYDFIPWAGNGKQSLGACSKLIVTMRSGKQYCLVRASYGAKSQLQRMKKQIDEFLHLPGNNCREGKGEVIRLWHWLTMLSLGAVILWIVAYGPSTNPERRAFSEIQERTGKDLATATYWNTFHRILALNLDGCEELGDEIAPQLQVLAHVEKLNLRRTKLTDAIVPVLAQLTTLQNLDIRNTAITAAGAKRLRSSLSDCEILWEDTMANKSSTPSVPTDLNLIDLMAVVQGIGTVQKNAALGIKGRVLLENVVAVQFEFRQSDNFDLDKIADAITSLENVALVFDGCPVHDDQLRRLHGLANIRGLSLVATPVTDGVLAQTMDLPGLIFLNLRNTPITNHGIKRLKGFASLKILDLSGCKITDDILPILKNLKHLEYLDVRDTSIHEDGARELHEALSNTTVVFN